jgi:hypothetical protein
MKSFLYALTIPILFLISCAGTKSLATVSSGFANSLVPLSIGNSWTFTSKNGKAHLTLFVANDTCWNGQTYSVLKEISNGDTTSFLYFIRTDSKGDIFLVEGGRTEFKFDTKLHTNQTYSNGIYNITVTTSETLTTPAGVIRNSLDFYVDSPRIADEETGYTFAKGVGFVRIYGSWDRDFRLVSYTIK